MRINADFSLKVLVIPRAEDWVRSPESGVDRLMLDRIGDEVARATSLVRYAAGSAFPSHAHPKGEEFLVLDGVFSDDSGDYPAGTYVRNPPGTRHAPHSTNGCRIFVKLRQFDADDLTPVVVDSAASPDWEACSDGVERLPLHSFGAENVAMLRLAGGTGLALDGSDGGLEMLLVAGEATCGDAVLPAESWLRLPRQASATLNATVPATLWLKTGHLPVDS
jgi:anti-sigma factor ChrR (cupin superfamily)